jgi:hypothetical protein
MTQRSRAAQFAVAHNSFHSLDVVAFRIRLDEVLGERLVLSRLYWQSSLVAVSAEKVDHLVGADHRCLTESSAGSKSSV